MRTLVVFCLVLFGWVQAAPQSPDVHVSALGAASASADVSSVASTASDVLQRASSLGSVLSQVGADSSSSSSSSSNVASDKSSSASSSFSSSSSSSSTLEKSSAASSAISSSSTLFSNTAFGKSSADSSATPSTSSSSSSFSADAALEKSRSESSAASSASSSASSSSSSHVAEAALEKSSLESASASLASSPAQSSSVASSGSSAASDIHHAAGVVDSGKSEVSGVSSAASSVDPSGSVGAAAKPDVAVDSVKAEHANVAAAPPPPPPTSGLTVEAAGSSSDADIPLKKVPVYVPVEYSASYQPENFFNPYSSARYNPYVSNHYGAFRTPGMPWYQLVSPEVPILTLYSGESHGANVEQREAWSPWTPVPYAKVGLACSHPESRWGYAPASGLVAASPLPYSPEALPTYRLHLSAPAVTPVVLGKTSTSYVTPWSHVIPAEVAKAAEPWNPYGPVQKLYIPDSFTSPAHAELVKTSSGDVSPWIPLSGFVDQAKSAWSPNNEGAPVFGIEKAYLASPWASNAHHNNGQARFSVPWGPASSASGVDLSRASFSIDAPSAYPVPSGFDLTTASFVAPAWIEKSAPVAVEPPWIPLEPSPSSPKEVRKSSAYNSMFWNPVLEETLKHQRAFSYPGSEYSYLPRYFLRSVGRRQ